MSTPRATQRSLQSLLLKRFGMATASYALTGLLCWVAQFNGLFRASIATTLLLSTLAALTQAVFLGLFLSRKKSAFSRPQPD